MSNGLYVSMAGAAARSEQLDAISDNLANVQTPGFRSTKVAFQSFLASPGVTDKVFPAAVSSGLDMKPGQQVVTDSPMDVVPDGMTFMAVGQPNGAVAYTRNGALQVINNTLVSGGMPVMDVTGKAIMIPPDGEPRMDPDGSVFVGSQVVGRVATFELSGNIQRLGATLYAPGPGGAATPAAEPALAVGELEMGYPLEASIGMITAQRSYDMSIKALETYRSLDTRAVEIGRVR
ncbi:MAG: flagellar hook basal-body protein [Deltaproteobacteria bacterium]|nr:flagellar hook basal-body protein [Deltaproteobacteria bacterium]